VLLEEVRRIVGQIREKWPGVKITLRGEMEKRIKEQRSLFADRTSTAYLRSNQVRRCTGSNPQVAAAPYPSPAQVPKGPPPTVSDPKSNRASNIIIRNLTFKKPARNAG
jgi:hypothetical protein